MQHPAKQIFLNITNTLVSVIPKPHVLHVIIKGHDQQTIALYSKWIAAGVTLGTGFTVSNSLGVTAGQSVNQSQPSQSLK